MRRAVALLAAAWGPLLARAEPYSADIELVEPVFSGGGLPWIDTPFIGESGQTRLGVALQLEDDPLVLYSEGREVASFIHRRAAAATGVSSDVTPRISLRAILPGVWQWSAEGEPLDSGPVLGDIRVGGRFSLHHGGPFTTALRLDARLPTGASDAWSGEDMPRLLGGVLCSAGHGPVVGFADLGFLRRPRIETPYDLVLGTELTASVGARWTILPERLGFSAGALARQGLTAEALRGGETPIEAIGGIWWKTSPSTEINVGIGRGVTRGYGTTDWRLLSSWTVALSRRTPTPVEPLSEILSPPELIDAPSPPEPTPEPQTAPEPPVAVLMSDHIAIRDPIRFEFGTARILPESLPILQEVANLMIDHAEIVHLLVIGHASEEGTFAFNYRLSNDRARAIFEELVRAGVHPHRLSYRGMGEVTPVETLGAAPENRRVEFSILSQVTPSDAPPAEDIVLPWSGERLRDDHPEKAP